MPSLQKLQIEIDTKVWHRELPALDDDYVLENSVEIR